MAARAIATLDVMSGGRAEVGLGAGWLRAEWTAAGLDPRTRGRRLDESLAVCKRLWSEAVIEHRGEFYAFDPVMFEPKPIQEPWPKIHVGGESAAALRRAAAHADGWFGLAHTPASAAERVVELQRLRAQAGRADAPFEVTVSSTPMSRDEVAAFADAGVDRLVVSPWRRSRESLEAIRAFAGSVILRPGREASVGD